MSEKQEYNHSAEKSGYDVPPPYAQHVPPPQVQSRSLADSYYSNSPNSSPYPAASSSHPSGNPPYSAGPSGYPPYPGRAGHVGPPNHPSTGGYPAQQGYPPQQGYPSQQGYPPPQGYPSQQGHPQQGAYPPYMQGGPGYADGDRGHHQFGDHPELQVFSYTGTKPATKRDPLSPAPPSFARAPNPGLPYPPLMEPLRIPTQDGANLSAGFVPLFPAPPLLLAHDVHPADISRLLEDCYLVCQLGIGQRIGAQVAPMTIGAGFLPGIFISRAIENHMKGKKVNDVEGLVNVWDEAFFAPRRLSVWIDHGMAQHAGRSRKDSSSSSSSSDDDARGTSRRERKEARREAKKERKEARRERRAAKKASRHGGSAQRVYLVIGNR